MTKIGLVVILILIAGKNYGQQNYFVLIQADNKQAFYIRLGSRSFSSSTEGSLILSQLKDSVYDITVGFPGQLFPEQSFLVDLHHKDQQYLLRNQPEKGWVLYNPLTGEMRAADLKEEKGADLRPQGVKKDDAFSRLMAGVVHDTAVMYNTYAAGPSNPDSSRTSVAGMTVIESPVTATSVRSGIDSSIVRAGSHADTPSVPMVSPGAATTLPVNTVGRPDSAVITQGGGFPAPTGGSPVPGNTSSVPGVVSSVPVDSSLAPGPVTAGSDSIAKHPAGRPNIIKLSERKMPHSLRLAFSDSDPGRKADTVILYIMKDTPALSGPRPATSLAATGSLPSSPGKPLHSADTGRRVSPRTSGPNTDTSVPASGTPGTTANAGEIAKTRPDTAQKRPPARAPLPFVNSDCHNFATDYDVDKLRVKMLESTRDEDRIQAARKVFKTKCFNTRQIKALSEVFTTDALKFKFFETAYPFASDDHFRELAGTLADPVYNSKFKAMTGQQ